jgi:hypothetical protein
MAWHGSRTYRLHRGAGLTSTFGFAPIGAYLAEFSRALDEPAFSPGPFLVIRGLITEAVDFPICHVDCFAPTSFVTLVRDSAVGKTALREPSDRHRPRRTIALSAAPFIYALQE